MVDSLVAYDGDEIGSSNGISYGNGDRKIGGCTLVEQSFVSAAITQVGSSVVSLEGRVVSSIGISYVKVVYSVGSSLVDLYGKLEDSPLGEQLFGSESGTEVGSSSVSSGGKVDEKLELYPLEDALGPGSKHFGCSSYGRSDGGGKLEGYPLGNPLVPVSITEVGYYDGISDGEVS